VTSTRSGEGKTYISIKIASIYAALGKKTLILGMDLRKPRLHKELNLNNDRGVTTYLLQEGEDWEGMVQSTTQEDLFVLSAGPYLERSSELINTPRFESLILSLKSKFDFIIIDTPPIALVSETLDLTKYSDVNLFIFRQNYSFINQANVANDLKNKFEIENLYAIINDTYKTGLGDYGYGYGYGYGYYSDSEGYLDNPSKSKIGKLLKKKR
jgi:capsular exopolysaccharide synthesis family protein